MAAQVAGSFGLCTDIPVATGAVGCPGGVTDTRGAVMPVSRVGHGDEDR